MEAQKDAEESLDFKALRARFHAEVKMATLGGAGAGAPRVLQPGVGRAGTPMAFNSPVNGVIRPRVSPAGPKPLPGIRSSPEMHRLPKPPIGDPGGLVTVRKLPPVGIFPRPPPSHRAGHQDNKMTIPVTDRPGRVKATGELLQNIMLKQTGLQDVFVPKPAPPVTTPLRSQRSMTEVPPLRRNLPPEGPRPLKPKRPPYVNLDSFRRALFAPMPRHPMAGGGSPSIPGSASPSGPPSLPARPSILTLQHSTILGDDDQDTYDDVDVLPPPPPPPPKYSGSREDSWTDHGSTQGDEESGDSELYEPIDEPEPPNHRNDKKKKGQRQQLEMKNKEQKLKERKENECRKRFKLTEPVEVLHVAKVRHDWQGGKNDLSVQQGDSIEILRVKNNPEGRWLARTFNGSYGYISNTCVDLDYEEVRRSFLSKTQDASLPPPPSVQNDEYYDDVGSSEQINSCVDLEGDEVYDDVQQPDEFPPPPPEASFDPKKVKKQEKEEREFRKKFKFEGPITVHCNMLVNPDANIKKGGGKDLSLSRGEILDVIQFVSDKKALCRNQQGKYGYAPLSVLLQVEGDIYDDVDTDAVVYDNDNSSTVPRPWS